MWVASQLLPGVVFRIAQYGCGLARQQMHLKSMQHQTDVCRMCRQVWWTVAGTVS